LRIQPQEVPYESNTAKKPELNHTAQKTANNQSQMTNSIELNRSASKRISAGLKELSL
jgi:hypothetical protein